MRQLGVIAFEVMPEPCTVSATVPIGCWPVGGWGGDGGPGGFGGPGGPGGCVMDLTLVRASDARPPSGLGPQRSGVLRSRSELPTTKTELNAMARPATIGFR